MNLNPAHLHIMLNHIPLFGSLFAALLMVRKRHRAGRGLSILALVISLVGFAAVSRAALLGGEIRHPEARADFVVPAESHEEPREGRPAEAPR